MNRNFSKSSSVVNRNNVYLRGKIHNIKTMKQLLRNIIVDQKEVFQRSRVVKRMFPENLLSSEEIVVITGVRRCGKSVLLQQIRKNFTRSDYFFNFDDDRLRDFGVEHFQLLYEVFVEMYGEQNHFFFDEIQNVSGWEHFVKRLYNSGKKVFITGSNANMLSRELGTYLTGCYVSIELYPFSFIEFLHFSGEKHILEDIDGTIQRSRMLRLFNEYMQDGGFPMYLQSKNPEILRTLYDNILYRDVLVRNQIVNERELKELMYFAVSNIGKLFTYNSLTKVIGVKNATTVKNYISYVENTYLLCTLGKIDASVKAQLNAPKKFYCIDNAIALRLGYHFSEDMGRLLENMIYVELRRRGGELFYFNNGGSSECDFIVRDGFRVRQALQVSVSLTNQATREREIHGLLSAMNAFGLHEGYIITHSDEDIIAEGSKVIYVLPAWRWMLRG